MFTRCERKNNTSLQCYLGWDLCYQVVLVGVCYLNRLPIKFNLPQNCALKRNHKQTNHEWIIDPFVKDVAVQAFVFTAPCLWWPWSAFWCLFQTVQEPLKEGNKMCKCTSSRAWFWDYSRYLVIWIPTFSSCSHCPKDLTEFQWLYSWV